MKCRLSIPNSPAWSSCRHSREVCPLSNEVSVRFSLTPQVGILLLSKRVSPNEHFSLSHEGNFETQSIEPMLRQVHGFTREILKRWIVERRNGGMRNGGITLGNTKTRNENNNHYFHYFCMTFPPSFVGPFPFCVLYLPFHVWVPGTRSFPIHAESTHHPPTEQPLTRSGKMLKTAEQDEQHTVHSANVICFNPMATVNEIIKAFNIKYCVIIIGHALSQTTR